MQISPVYDRPLVTFDGAPPVGPPLIRQRLRLLDVLADLSDDQWAAPSRCEGWRVQDVAAHIISGRRLLACVDLERSGRQSNEVPRLRLRPEGDPRGARGRRAREVSR